MLPLLNMNPKTPGFAGGAEGSRSTRYPNLVRLFALRSLSLRSCVCDPGFIASGEDVTDEAGLLRLVNWFHVDRSMHVFFAASCPDFHGLGLVLKPCKSANLMCIHLHKVNQQSAQASSLYRIVRRSFGCFFIGTIFHSAYRIKTKTNLYEKDFQNFNVGFLSVFAWM
jgi:hypothetical protein